MGAQGTGVLDFGTFPGTDVASLAVTGQAGILTSSLIEAWIIVEATAQHSEDEILILSDRIALGIPASLVVAGTGFTVKGYNYSERVVGTVKFGWVWN